MKIRILVAFVVGTLCGASTMNWFSKQRHDKPSIRITGILNTDTSTHEPGDEPPHLCLLHHPVIEETVYLEFSRHADLSSFYGKNVIVTGQIKTSPGRKGKWTEFAVEKIGLVSTPSE